MRTLQAAATPLCIQQTRRCEGSVHAALERPRHHLVLRPATSRMSQIGESRPRSCAGSGMLEDGAAHVEARAASFRMRAFNDWTDGWQAAAAYKDVKPPVRGIQSSSTEAGAARTRMHWRWKASEPHFPQGIFSGSSWKICVTREYAHNVNDGAPAGERIAVHA